VASEAPDRRGEASPQKPQKIVLLWESIHKDECLSLCAFSEFCVRCLRTTIHAETAEHAEHRSTLRIIHEDESLSLRGFSEFCERCRLSKTAPRRNRRTRGDPSTLGIHSHGRESVPLRVQRVLREMSSVQRVHAETAEQRRRRLRSGISRRLTAADASVSENRARPRTPRSCARRFGKSRCR
jgi:hypothetical protein